MNTQSATSVFGVVDVPGWNAPALSVGPAGGSTKRVIVLPGIHGRTSHALGVAERLASHGYEAVLADFYCTAAQLGELRTPADIAPAVAALNTESIVGTVAELTDSLARSGSVAVLGYCVGGTFALLAATRSDASSGTIAYYGVLRNLESLVDGQADPVDALNAVRRPILAHYGLTDVWCSVQDLDDLDAQLAISGAPYQVYRYPGAGHAFEEPGSKGFRPVAAAEAAHRTLTFLDHYLDQ